MSKTKDPAVLFYTADFLTGVSGLTMDERGQYITLLCLQHQQGHLTEKQIRLAVGDITDDVRAKFVVDDSGRFYNERMETESEKRRAFIESRTRASHSRFTRKASETSHDTSYDNQTIHRAENENINGNINSNDNVVTKAVRHKYGEYLNVLLSDEELEKVKAEFPIDWSERIERLSEYIATSGKKYKSHIAVIRSWARRDTEAPAPTQDQHQTNARPTQEAARFNTFNPQKALEDAIARSDRYAT